MTLCLDTTVLVDVIQGQPNVRGRWREALATRTPLVTSLISFHELIYGAEASPAPDRERRAVDGVLRRAPAIPFEERDMIAAARARADLRRRGEPVGPYDLLIAGQALARGWTLVTSNIREFRRIQGLNLIDWREQQR